MEIKNHHNKNVNIFAFYIFGLKCCLHPSETLNLSKKTSPQELFDYDCVTLYDITYFTQILNSAMEKVSCNIT